MRFRRHLGRFGRALRLRLAPALFFLQRFEAPLEVVERDRHLLRELLELLDLAVGALLGLVCLLQFAGQILDLRRRRYRRGAALGQSQQNGKQDPSWQADYQSQ